MRKALSLTQAQHEYRLAARTLNDWINLGVVEKRQGKLDGRGASMWLLEPDQLERLERFIRYREWLIRRYNSEKPQIPEIVSLLDEVDNGNFDEVISILSDIEQDLQEKVEDIQLEIQSLHAKKHGEPEIDPSQAD